MGAAEEFRKRKGALAQLFKEATQPVESEPPEGKPTLRLHITVIVCLLGTTLPFQVVSALFCVTSLLLIGTALRRSARPTRSVTSTICALAAASILTGCSPALFDSSREDILTLCAPGPECKIGYAQGLRIMGIDVISVSIEDAIANGDIKEIKVVQYKEGFGLISLTRIQAYGS